MDKIIEIVRIFNSTGNLREKLGENHAILIDACTTTSIVDGVLFTNMQQIIQETLSLEFSNAACYFLSLQAEYLPDSCSITFLTQARLFFTKAAKAQISTTICFKEVVSVSQKLLDISNMLGASKAVIRSLINASDLIAQSGVCLTPIHAKILQACISSQMYSFAVSYLRNKTILEIDPKVNGLTSLDFLTYFYYGGICFIAVKDFPAALDCFQQAITAPAQVVSAVVIESIKKARLVSLIYYGVALDIPKYASQPVKAFAKQELEPYCGMAKAFSENDDAALQAVVVAHEQELKQDNNWGLAQQVVASLTHHKIRKLSSTYLSMSLSDIALAIGAPLAADPSVAEKALLQMIAQGEVQASIDDSTGMVSFGDGVRKDGALEGASEDFASRQQQALVPQLERHMQETIALANKLRELHKQTLTSTNYISRSISGGGSSRGGPVGAGWGGHEEIMDYSGLGYK